MKKNEVFRILDANLNRAREGLRVCEDILRFFLNDKNLTQNFKSARHNITTILKPYNFTKTELLKHRDSQLDVGKDLVIKKVLKFGIIELFSINIQRAQEALRVLEEVSKIIDHRLEHKFRRLRFKLYFLESKASRRLLEHGKNKH